MEKWIDRKMSVCGKNLLIEEVTLCISTFWTTHLLLLWGKLFTNEIIFRPFPEHFFPTHERNFSTTL